MSIISIRKSGGANIISIPKAITDTLGLKVGSTLDLSIKGNKIVLTPVAIKYTLESLLEGSSRENFALDAEGEEWVDAKPIGKEL
ncbi:MAG: AbrB/MazE/SpoVT family DNA-binding domain-containing protein [SAR86 cluster bacterium]|uniref:AbrB/MazE/SpoVT family DNA-binding domain-containing protein n=1 Tax=SAR86 cluster bacterium TaxID=2030880 RepID=A0A2A5AC89_9GAMM|nr:MAG: AbrB/MazE/SpoVT family DNA-binding domain-containing protein [SAR86 cluster bacterium]